MIIFTLLILINLCNKISGFHLKNYKLIFYGGRIKEVKNLMLLIILKLNIFLYLSKAIFY